MGDFAKYQALGNDYLVIDPAHSEFTITSEVVRLLCDRHQGVGADGILVGPLGPPPLGDPVELSIFNSDGSPCEKSGNGLRMFALYLAEQYGLTEGAVLRTIAGDSQVDILDRVSGRVRAGMGKPSFDTEAPVHLTAGSRQFTVTCLHLGNPHAVVVSDRVSPELAREFGPLLARHPSFPEAANVQFARVLDRRRIALEVWERGAGYTLASGSSACAAVAAAHRQGLVDDVVRAEMPGGAVDVTVAENGEITLTGEAEPVASGHFSAVFRARLRAAAQCEAASP
ncbi:diaminopimelate epimerase [Streptomyces sp. NPDC059894]|uniref:diaminopimelate epimerase n=1 Tax=unclassified Streptomyces TaxID=2593676 RepID=UPI0036486B88